jgi:predicted amidohydrolase YtcJ
MSASGRAADDARPADRLILGRVATLAGATGPGWAEGLAIRDGRVVATGSARELDALRGRRTEVWRPGEGRVVLPGIVDAHLHLASAALTARQPDLGGHGSRDEVLMAIGAAHERMVASGDQEGWLLGHGWSLDQLGAWPRATDLDAVAPGRPVALWSHDHHSRWVSGAALAAAGITLTTPDPAGGRIGRDASGDPDGMLSEGAATLVDRAIPDPDAERLATDLEAFAADLARLGVVGAHDPGEIVADPRMRRGPTFYRALAAAGRLPIRVVACVRDDQLEVAIAVGIRTGREVAVGPGGAGDPCRDRIAARYRDGWLKLFADGALGSRSAALLAPYEADDPGGLPIGGPRGMALRSRDALADMAGQAARAGIAVQIHGIGDAAVRLDLDVLSALPRVGAAHHRVEHAQLVDPTDIPRFGTAGIVASVQPCHLIGDAPAARAAWGDRTAGAFPLRSLIDAGALLAFGTDAPVEPPDPWPGIAAAVTRASGDWPSDRPPFHPEQALGRWEAIRAATRGPATSLGVADEGHLGPGTRADLIVVDAAAVDEPPGPGGALERCRPFATLIDGDVVWRDPGFDP